MLHKCMIFLYYILHKQKEKEKKQMKFSIAMITVLCLILCSASTMAGGSILAGGGAKVSMFGTQGVFSETAPFTMLGYGLTVNPDFGDGIVPHETYGIVQFGRVKDLSTGEFTAVRSYSLAGLWYLTDSTQKWQSFILMRANAETLDQPGPGSTTYLNGDFGLGGAIPVAKKTHIFGAFSLNMGKKISADFGAGVKVRL